jgi:hypothetical protein
MKYLCRIYLGEREMAALPHARELTDNESL